MMKINDFKYFVRGNVFVSTVHENSSVFLYKVNLHRKIALKKHEVKQRANERERETASLFV